MKHTVTVPKDILHASGLRAARYLGKWVAVGAIIGAIAIAFHDDDLQASACFLILIPTSMLAGYSCGRWNPVLVKDYLEQLQKRCDDIVDDIEKGGDDKIKEETEMRLQTIKYDLHEYYLPHIDKYLAIDTASPTALQDLKKPAEALSAKCLRTKDEYVKSIGEKLELRLADAVLDAIREKKEIDFPHYYILRMPFANKHKKILQEVAEEFFLRKLSHQETKKEISTLISKFEDVTA